MLAESGRTRRPTSHRPGSMVPDDVGCAYVNRPRAPTPSPRAAHSRSGRIRATGPIVRRLNGKQRERHGERKRRAPCCTPLPISTHPDRVTFPLDVLIDAARPRTGYHARTAARINLLNDVGARAERLAHVGALVGQVHVAAAVRRVEHEAAAGALDQRRTLRPRLLRHFTRHVPNVTQPVARSRRSLASHIVRVGCHFSPARVFLTAKVLTGITTGKRKRSAAHNEGSSSITRLSCDGDVTTVRMDRRVRRVNPLCALDRGRLRTRDRIPPSPAREKAFAARKATLILLHKFSLGESHFLRTQFAARFVRGAPRLIPVSDHYLSKFENKRALEKNEKDRHSNRP